MVLGAISLLFLGYAIAIYHPIRNTLTDYAKSIWNLLCGGHPESKDHKLTETLKFGLVLGVIYFAGVLVNSCAYCLLEDAHADIISHVKPSEPDGKLAVVSDSQWSFIWMPIPIARNWYGEMPNTSEAEKVHADSLYREMAWRNNDRETANETLDPIRKFIRLLRGTVLLAMCFALVAIIKVFCEFFIWVVIWIVSKTFSAKSDPDPEWRRVRLINRIYANFVDYDWRWLKETRKGYQKATSWTTLQAKKGANADDFKSIERLTMTKAVLPNILICSISLLIYVVAVWSWRSAEIEYHSMVISGYASMTSTSQSTISNRIK